MYNCRMRRNTPVPKERKQTLRQQMKDLLGGAEASAAELSKIMGVSEKEILDHLAHLEKAGILAVDPARCRKCGFVFDGRTKVKKPGRCPQCKSTFIEAPLFSAKSKK